MIVVRTGRVDEDVRYHVQMVSTNGPSFKDYVFVNKKRLPQEREAFLLTE